MVGNAPCELWGNSGSRIWDLGIRDGARTSFLLDPPSRSRSCSCDFTRTRVSMYMSLIDIGSRRQPFATHSYTDLISSSVPCRCSHFLRITQRSLRSSQSFFICTHSSCTAIQFFFWSSRPCDLLRMMPSMRKSLSATARAFASSNLLRGGGDRDSEGEGRRGEL